MCSGWRSRKCVLQIHASWFHVVYSSYILYIKASWVVYDVCASQLSASAHILWWMYITRLTFSSSCQHLHNTCSRKCQPSFSGTEYFPMLSGSCCYQQRLCLAAWALFHVSQSPRAQTHWLLQIQFSEVWSELLWSLGKTWAVGLDHMADGKVASLG